MKLPTSTLAGPQLDAFEVFYRDVRGRLLLQTWALTGDLPAAQKAVRDALAIAAQHWRKVRTNPNGEDYVRPIAWSHALRRHQVPHLTHRERQTDPAIRATLDALAKLPLVQRKVLLLTHLTTIPHESVAREVGITLPRAEKELFHAMASLVSALNLPSPDAILGLFEPMAAIVEGERWPRPTILARQGSARRQWQTLALAAITIAATVGAGFGVTSGGSSITPSLNSLAWLHTYTNNYGPYPLKVDALLDTDSLALASTMTGDSGPWTSTLTSDGIASSHLQLPCGTTVNPPASTRDAVLRTFTSTSPASVGQMIAASTTTSAATSLLVNNVRWYSQCQGKQVQLLSTKNISNIGDQAIVTVARDWSTGNEVLVGSARTGILSTSIAVTAKAEDDHHLQLAQQLLASAVNRVCNLPAAGACASSSGTITSVRPLATMPDPGLVSEIDLPPVSDVNEPWVGTDPAPATTNAAATHCDQTTFDAPAITRTLTRTFVIPTDTSLAAQFGLTETIGAFTTKPAAASFVKAVSKKIASCEKNELGSAVTTLPIKVPSLADAGSTIKAWKVHVALSANTSVTYLMAIVRDGISVAQIGFVPSGKVTLSDSNFEDLVQRATLRLPYFR